MARVLKDIVSVSFCFLSLKQKFVKSLVAPLFIYSNDGCLLYLISLASCVILFHHFYSLLTASNNPLPYYSLCHVFDLKRVWVIKKQKEENTIFSWISYNTTYALHPYSVSKKMSVGYIRLEAKQHMVRNTRNRYVDSWIGP